MKTTLNPPTIEGNVTKGLLDGKPTKKNYVRNNAYEGIEGNICKGGGISHLTSSQFIMCLRMCVWYIKTSVI